MDEKKIFNNREVLIEEDKILTARRKKIFSQEDAEKLKDTRFGIALSGGGIRSATINLGFLKTLNNFGILKRADYLSTVSGGGYTGSYIQTTIKNYKSYSETNAFKTYQNYANWKSYTLFQANKSLKELEGGGAENEATFTQWQKDSSEERLRSLMPTWTIWSIKSFYRLRII